jgi:hypothetical protein
MSRRAKRSTAKSSAARRFSPRRNFALLPAAPGIRLGLWRRGDVAPPADAPGGGEIAFTVESETEVAVTIARWQALGARVYKAAARHTTRSSRFGRERRPPHHGSLFSPKPKGCQGAQPASRRRAERRVLDSPSASEVLAAVRSTAR